MVACATKKRKLEQDPTAEALIPFNASDLRLGRAEFPVNPVGKGERTAERGSVSGKPRNKARLEGWEGAHVQRRRDTRRGDQCVRSACIPSMRVNQFI